MGLFWMVVRSFFEVLIVGALFGAGLPALYAIGVRLLAWSREPTHALNEGLAATRSLAKYVAYAIFALALAIALLGIAVIVASGSGMKINFAGVFPVFVR